MAMTPEMTEKQRRVNEFLDRERYDALLLVGADNFAWFTGGGQDYVNTADPAGVGALLITRETRTLITNNVERPRLVTEELAEQALAEEIVPWYDDAVAPVVARLAPRKKVASDVSLPGVTACPEAIMAMRRSLTVEEVGRYRALGREVGEALMQACMDVEPGMTEHDAAAAVAREHWARGIVPIVVLVAADERLMKYRHPLPTSNPIQFTVMLVVCGRRHGLIVSATRLVHFGTLPAVLRRKHDAVVAVDAAFMAATRPGARIGDVFRTGLAVYRAQGFADEWTLHHQGGPTGYAARDYRATADSEDLVEPNQAFAWNPSITGTKSEDTIIAAPGGPEIISASPSFPAIEVAVAGNRKFARADILVR